MYLTSNLCNTLSDRIDVPPCEERKTNAPDSGPSCDKDVSLSPSMPPGWIIVSVAPSRDQIQRWRHYIFRGPHQRCPRAQSNNWNYYWLQGWIIHHIRNKNTRGCGCRVRVERTINKIIFRRQAQNNIQGVLNPRTSTRPPQLFRAVSLSTAIGSEIPYHG